MPESGDARRRPAPKKPVAKKSSKPAPKKRARRRGSMTVRFALAAVVLVGLLFAFVYPTRTFLDQRSETNHARAQLALLESQNKSLAAEAKRLQSPAEVEKRARAYGLVKPNEHAFVIVPAPTVATVAPAADTTAPK